MAHWFIACPVPAGDWYRKVRGAPKGVRVLCADDLHLTLAFLGSVGEERARKAWDARSFDYGPEPLTLGAMEALGNPHRPSALSIVMEPGDARARLEQAMGAYREAVLAAAEVPPDGRPPLAHVTLARIARDASAAMRHEALAWARSIPFRGATVELRDVALYTWTVDRQERLFQPVATRSLLPEGSV